MGQQRMRADLYEVAVLGAGGVYGLAESNRVAKIGHPVVGAEKWCSAGVFGGADHWDGRTGGSQVGQRGAQLGQDRVDRGVVRGDVDLYPAGEQTLSVHFGDQCVDLLGRPRDHSLARRGVDGDGDVGMVGDQPLSRVGVEFEQCHRALAGQPGHQPRPGGDHVQAFGGAERAGHHRGGDLAHRMPDDGVGLDTVRAPQLGQR